MELRGKDRAELEQLFTSRIESYASLSDEDRGQLLQMAEEQLQSGLPEPFIWSGVRSTSDLLLGAAESQRDGKVQQFMKENAESLRSPTSPRTQPRREVKQRARERLLETTRSLLREARAAKQPHERKKMRRSLLRLDQAHLVRVLGRDGQELCQQINDYLSRSHDLR